MQAALGVLRLLWRNKNPHLFQCVQNWMWKVKLESSESISKSTFIRFWQLEIFTHLVHNFWFGDLYKLRPEFNLIVIEPLYDTNMLTPFYKIKTTVSTKSSDLISSSHENGGIKLSIPKWKFQSLHKFETIQKSQPLYKFETAEKLGVSEKLNASMNDSQSILPSIRSTNTSHK